MALDTLIVLNVVVYSSLAVGLVILRRSGGAQTPTDTQSIYRLLEATFGRAFPELPKGFTWREGITWAKQKGGLKVEWESIDLSIQSYEAYKYGNAPLPDKVQPELLKLIRALGGPG